eukprot:g6219.t1
MFVSPFTVSVSCDAAIIVIYLQRTGEFGGSSWFGIEAGHGFTTEVVDLVWLAIVRIAFLLPHILEFLKRRRLSCPGFHHSFVVANFFFVVAKAIAILVHGPQQSVAFFWWLLVVLSAISVVAQRGCLHHLRSTMPTPRYKTIFMGSRLDARLLGEQYGYDTSSDDEYDDEYDSDYSYAEEYPGGSLDAGDGVSGGAGGGGGGPGGSEESKGTVGLTRGASRQYSKAKARRPRSGSRGTVSTAREGRRRRRRRRGRSRSRSSRQESTRELVDFFADRMQEARDAWSARVRALQKRWQASFLSGDGWGMRGGGSQTADRDAALRLTFGLIVRMYAYDDALQDLAEQDPICLEAFAPQFASFLVWDSYYMSGQMEAWLLARCSENLYFAHALEFQLRASCLPPVTAADTASSGRGPVSDAAGNPTAAGDGTSSPSTGRPPSTRRSSSGVDLSAITGGRKGLGEEEDDGGGAAIDRVGRRAVELLLQEVAENGELAARRLVEEADSLRRGGSGGGSGYAGNDSPGLALGEAAGTGAGAGTATAVVAGGEGLEGNERAKSEAGVDVGGAGSSREGEKQAPLLYRQTVDFLARLADIASSLTPLSKAERTPVLKDQLRDVGSKFLGPSSGVERLVYVPVGGRHHRVVAVHPSESFAFSTRERAPCFICLEVVGAKEPALQRRPWWQDGGGAPDNEEEEGGEGEEGGGNMLSRRMQALRQWLPSGVSFQQRFRLLPGSIGGGGGGRGWRLFVGTDDAEAGGAVGSEEEGREDTAAGGTHEDLEQGRGGSSHDEKSRSTAGEEDVRVSEENKRLGRVDSRGDGDGGKRYRPLAGEPGAEGAGAEAADASRGVGGGDGEGSPLSSASGSSREWWAASKSGTGRPWGGEDDVGDNALADVPSSASRVPVDAETAPAAAAAAVRGRREEGDKETGDGDTGEAGADGSGSLPPSQPQVLFNELWQDKSNRIRMVSPWAGEPGWRLLPVIVKANDDLRQEQLASQLLFVMQRILRAEGVRAWLRPYDIVALSADTGIVEAVPDTISLDALRRYRRRGAAGGGGGGGDPASSSSASRFSLTGFFEARFGAKGSEGFRQAQRRFIESLAAYSIACYLLQIKDRHNGNILLDADGHVIHVDFGALC